jgi:hypothetical protein
LPQRRGGALSDDPAVVDDRDPLRFFHVVRGEKYRHLPVAAEGARFSEGSFARFWTFAPSARSEEIRPTADIRRERLNVADRHEPDIAGCGDFVTLEPSFWESWRSRSAE